MKIRFKRIRANAVLPVKSYDSDFAYDVTAASVEEVSPGVYRYNLGFAFQIVKEPDDPIFCFRLAPRSSIYKTGMIMSSSECIIDAGYTGEPAMIFYHIDKTLPKYEVGDRVGQMYVQSTLPLDFVEEDFEPTDRGNSGFGSSGK